MPLVFWTLRKRIILFVGEGFEVTVTKSPRIIFRFDDGVHVEKKQYKANRK